MNQKQLKKLIEKSYEENDQHLYVTTVEDWWWKAEDKWWRPKNRCCVDIVLTDKIGKKFGNYLFTISNLFYYEDIIFQNPYTSFYEHKLVHSSNLVDSAHKPLYINQEFTLKKFTNITKQDILNCTKYLVRKILNYWLIFNFEVVIPPKK